MLRVLGLPKMLKKSSVKGLEERARSEKLFSKTIIQKIFETSSSFRVNYGVNYGENSISISQNVLASIEKKIILLGRLGTSL